MAPMMAWLITMATYTFSIPNSCLALVKNRAPGIARTTHRITYSRYLTTVPSFETHPSIEPVYTTIYDHGVRAVPHRRTEPHSRSRVSSIRGVNLAYS